MGRHRNDRHRPRPRRRPQCPETLGTTHRAPHPRRATAARQAERHSMTRKFDANDILREAGEDALRSAFDQTERINPTDGAEASGGIRAVPFKWIDTTSIPMR